MKYKWTKHWKDKKNQQGLLFFANILDESLFDYSLDTYKPQALNVRLLCIEGLQTIDNINSGLIKKPNIESIIDELLFNLNSDFVAREILGEKLEGIVAKISANRTNLKKLREVIFLLYHYFDNKKYLNKLQDILVELVPLEKEKEKIYFATKSYVTELINYGYTLGYLYYKTRKFYFNTEVPVTCKDPKKFFSLFDFKDKKFSVYFIANKLYQEFKYLEEPFKFQIVAQHGLPNLKPHEKGFFNGKTKDDLLIVFKEIEAFDENSARIRSEIMLIKLGNFFSFYHHKEIPKINPEVLVFNLTDNYSIIREQPIKSIIKKEDIKPKVAAEKVKSLFQLDLAPKTISTIGRAMELHSIALETPQIENKLLNLWTAIETLIPKDMESNTDRIVQIISALTPFQCNIYFRTLILQAGLDFWHFNNKVAAEFIAKAVNTDKRDRFHSIASIIMTAENEELRKELYVALEKYPLLKWRLFFLNKHFSSGKNAKKLIESHKQKVEWQIRRIYRVRNLIVHSGKMPSYTNILVENLHNYFDNILNSIIDAATNEKRLRTLREAILDAEIDYENTVRLLTELVDKKIDLKIYKKFV